MFYSFHVELKVLLFNTETITFRLLFFQTICIAHVTESKYIDIRNITETEKNLYFHILLVFVTALLNWLDGALLRPPLFKWRKDSAHVYLPLKWATFVSLVSSLAEVGISIRSKEKCLFFSVHCMSFHSGEPPKSVDRRLCLSSSTRLCFANI